MRRFTSIVLAMTMVIVSLSTTAFADDKKVQAPINISSKTAILMDVGSGQILFEKNPHEKLPPASVTKVMTMLLIVEALDSGKIKLDDEVQISERASEMGGSQIFLEPGETQKVDDLLKGIAVASANDACVAMAEFVGGSEEEFVAMMNNKAKQLGMKDTNFANTNGLPIENHYTSAHDIALMSRELLKHDKITKYLTTWMDQIVVGKKKTTIGLANTNKMIKHYQGATGVKTGFTQEAKYCLSASAKRGETHLVAVTLDKADDNKVNLVAKDDLTALIKKGESKDFTKKIDVSKNIDLPVKKGTKLGTISIYKGDKQVGKIDLINEKDINKASYFKMFERVIDNIF